MRNTKINQYNHLIAGTTIPGASLGFQTMDQVHEWNSKQIRRKGFFIATGTGSNTLDIKLPGSARLLCGLLIFDPTGDPQNRTNLILNNDSRIEQSSISSLVRVMPNFIDPAVTFANSYDKEYFELPALLSGNDSITMEFNMNSASRLEITFYYI